MDTKLGKKSDSKLSVCYFGTYEKNYPRNSIIIKGLKRNNVDVTECHVPFWEKTEDKTGKFFKSKFKIALNILKAYTKLIKKYRKSKKCDVIMVGYLGQFDMFLARLLAPRKKIIFNPMISLYDSLVFDRKLFKKGSLMANLSLLLDKISCKLASIVILDTREHARYFNRELKVKKRKLGVIPVGADNDVFSPSKKQQNSKINIIFYGKFTPIHGTEYIIKAAKELEKDNAIQFTVIGKGQNYEKDMKLVEKLKIKNINFIDWIPYSDLPKILADSDICLGGHFGKGNKAKRVIANKTFQMMSMKKPVIVSNSMASIEGGLQDEYNCIFCNTGDEKEIVNSINKIIKNKKLADKISKNSYELYKNNYTIEKIGERTKNIIKKILK
jgi:glycosyltransferase involved in cell wall biosynthesis